MRFFRCCCLIACVFAPGLSVRAQDRVQAVCEMVRTSPQVAGVPKKSDVCFSPRWPRKRPGGDPLEMAKRFHATRMEWVYLGNAREFCRQAARMDASVCGAVNSNLPDSTRGKPSYELGRARNLDGERVLPDFMRNWGCYWGCANNPEFRRIWLEHAELQIRAGAERLQNDGPRLSEGGMLHWGGCYCEYCVSGFRRYLSNTLAPARLTALDLAPIEEFDYAAYLRRNRDNSLATDEARERAADLLAMFQDFQRDSVLDFYKDVHAQLDSRVGHEVPISCNNAEGFLLYLHDVHDFAMFEAYPDKEGIPDFFYQERVLPFRRIGKPFVTTFVSDDVQHTRRMIAQSYAFGTHTIVPWDVFTGSSSPRVFGDPADSADLYGFVRANAVLFDGYEEGAVVGIGRDGESQADFPPLRVRGGSRRVVAVVRALPGQPNAPVVVHFIDWASRPEPFTVILEPRRFFGRSPLRVRLLTPALYDAAIHAQAAETGDRRELSVVKVCMAGHQTQVELPALRPWGMLVVDRSSEDDAQGIWSPQIWAEPESYYSDHLRVRMDCPSPDVTLRYTLDGSEPLPMSPRYLAPLVLSETTDVRARAFAQDGLASPHSQALFQRLGEGTETILLPDAPPLREHLRLWVSADSLSDSHADGDVISRWTSRAGPSPLHSQVRLLDGESSLPPMFRANRINGHAVVEFSESAHHLHIPNFSTRNLAGKCFTIFMVTRSSDQQFGFGGNALSGSGGVPRLYVTRGSLHFDVLRGIPTGAPAGRAAINTYMYDGKLLQTWVDGIARGRREQGEAVATFGGGGHFAIPFWGASRFHGGEMAEIAVFDRALTKTERESVEAYLADKYGILDRPKWR